MAEGSNMKNDLIKLSCVYILYTIRIYCKTDVLIGFFMLFKVQSLYVILFTQTGGRIGIMLYTPSVRY